MKESLVDISVLIIFFTRPDTLQQVFNRVKEARPARLFLYQDGPREGRPDDKENILKCRDIVSQVDWECEVHTLYQEKNYGADESGYIADKWAFSQTDKCLVLEDDVIPSLSYFAFCKEMLDRYEHDERVMLISGWNLEEVTKGVESDYFFSYTTFTMAWASWARVVNQWDAHFTWLKDQEKVERLRTHIRRNHLNRRWLPYFNPQAPPTKIRFETILIARHLLCEGLCIVPCKNMASNIGIGVGSSHYEAQLSQMARGDRFIFTMNSYEMDMAHLKHPIEVRDFAPYREHSYRIRAWGHPVIHAWRAIETATYQFFSGGNKKKILSELLKKVCNFLKGDYS